MNFAVTAVNSREGEGQIINVVFDWGCVSCFQYVGSLRRELFNQNTDNSVSKYREMLFFAQIRILHLTFFPPKHNIKNL